MNIISTQRGPVAIVSLNGRLAGDSPAPTEKTIKEMLRQHPIMVLDCRGLEYMDSSGLGTLIGCLRFALKNNGDLRLAALPGKVRMLLELTRADQVFRCYPDTEKAVDSYLFSHRSMFVPESISEEEKP